jgi:hypothetical protein
VQDSSYTWFFKTESSVEGARFFLHLVLPDLTAVGSWCQRWNIKMNEGKTQAIYFSRRRRMPEDELQLNGRNIEFVNNTK